MGNVTSRYIITGILDTQKRLSEDTIFWNRNHGVAERRTKLTLSGAKTTS